VVDYEAVIPFKVRLLKTAWKKSLKPGKTLRPASMSFCVQQEPLAGRLCVVPGAEGKYNGAYYLDWRRTGFSAMETLWPVHAGSCEQLPGALLRNFCCFRQGDSSSNTRIPEASRVIGDLPFFVSPESSVFGQNPSLFLLDEHRRPRFVAGVPPDYFSARDSCGKSVYNWEALRATGYRWAIDRIRALLAHVDAIAWTTSAASRPRGMFCGSAPRPSPENGTGPGAGSLKLPRKRSGGLRHAEDLGLITPDVYALRDQFQLPGT